MGKGRFVVNEHIIIYDINMKSNGIEYSFDWDHNNITEKDAIIIVEEFMQDTVDGIKKNIL